jgi:hypothetical protein
VPGQIRICFSPHEDQQELNLVREDIKGKSDLNTRLDEIGFVLMNSDCIRHGRPQAHADALISSKKQPTAPVQESQFPCDDGQRNGVSENILAWDVEVEHRPCNDGQEGKQD